MKAKSEMVAVTPCFTKTTFKSPLPVIERIPAPEPRIVRFFLIARSLVRTMRPLRPVANVIVLPGLAVAMIWRSEPGSSSLRVVTVVIVGIIIPNVSVATPDRSNG